MVDAKVFARKGQDKDERARAIEVATIARLQRNLDDEKRILNDERAKRLAKLLAGKVVVADLHDERTNKRLLEKDAVLTREILESLRARDLKRMRTREKKANLNVQIDEIEEMTVRQVQGARKTHRRACGEAEEGR